MQRDDVCDALIPRARRLALGRAAMLGNETNARD
jgi:hypothetical protein